MSFQEQELLMRKQTAWVVQVRTQYYESQLSKVVSSDTSVAGTVQCSQARGGRREAACIPLEQFQPCLAKRAQMH